MKIFLTASKNAYDKVADIKARLEKAGHIVTPPNGFGEIATEDTVREMSPEDYSNWKADMIREDGRLVAANDAVLALNFDKNGQVNYIGGATFLEMFQAFSLGKKLFLYNPIPEGMLKDEIIGLMPLVIDQDLSLVV